MSDWNIVICGSMSFYNDMLSVKKLLNAHGIGVLVPESDEDFVQYLLWKSEKRTIEAFKRTSSRTHIKKIWRLDTRAILVVNGRKNNIENYIGANTLAEIALAFALKKKIFLLYDIPNIYYDELSAWEANPLYGDIKKLVDEFKPTNLNQLLI